MTQIAAQSSLLVVVGPCCLLLPRVVSTLRFHDNARVRSLANSAAGFAVRAATDRVLLFLLAMFVSVGATSWDLVLRNGHPRAALLLLGVSMVAAWCVAHAAVALSRGTAGSKASVSYLLGVLTNGMLLLATWSSAQPRRSVRQ
ncbi:MAG: hypothetical protein JO352_12085 [Chloroflexi bacterium]|nr:hypothetical protein [Chloroflexota bacterium]MBV9601772.1 hypothetical protein [Chloroflexota bacterium]